MTKPKPLIDCCPAPEWSVVRGVESWTLLQLQRIVDPTRPGEFIAMMIDAPEVARCLHCGAVYLPSAPIGVKH